jgi:23S rRNA (guanine2445-N2)-methyltransferase / 23S rRNA (guanine2069-N7)-methyltransferase
MTTTNFFATCPKSLESLLAEELKQLGAVSTKETRAGVHFEATLTIAYRICLWSRLANQILMPIFTRPITDVESLYLIALHHVDWAEHMTVRDTFAIDVDLVSAPFTNSLFAMQRFKDGLADYWRKHTGTRPSVNTEKPDFRFHVLVKKETLTLSLNLSGESLHRRGIRTEGGSAPLKENLAAALLIRAGWHAIAKEGGSLFDPLCGSGTLLIEGAMIAADIAPGLYRSYFGFLKWQEFKPAIWKSLIEEAKTRREKGLLSLPKIIGYDAERSSMRIAEENIARAGLKGFIHVERRELAQVQTLSAPPGLVITNPPYGERLGEKEVLRFTYQHLGDIFKKDFSQWRCSVFTGNPDLAKALRLGPENIYHFFNGAIPCQLLNFVIRNKTSVCSTEPHKAPTNDSSLSTLAPSPSIPLPRGDREVIPLTEGLDFANRLRKNLAKLEPTAKKENIRCYRLYDADLPDYAIAIDRYEDFVHIQEYSPPKSIDPEKAAKRLTLAIHHTADILQIPLSQIFLKTRQKQKGKNQYEKKIGVRADQIMTENTTRGMIENSKRYHEDFRTVHENSAKLLVNFTDYLDTGLFLDSRLIRKYIFEHAKNKNFLNLFCYTGSATVYAALAKAASTTSIDMSATYLAWAKRNLALNGLAPTKHHFIQADCLQWLEKNTQKFDLILLDPPTFSNSKRMEDTLDIQRDQVKLIDLAMKHLSKDGTLIFVTNKNNFKLDKILFEKYHVENITKKTQPFDFKRYEMHQAFLLHHKT